MQEDWRQPQPALQIAGHEAVGEISVFLQVLRRSPVVRQAVFLLVLLLPAGACRVRAATGRPRRIRRRRPDSSGRGTEQGNTTLGFVSESGSFRINWAARNRDTAKPGHVSPDASQRHQRQADEGHRRSPRCGRRQRGVRRRSPHVRISRRVERPRLGHFGRRDLRSSLTLGSSAGSWKARPGLRT